MKKSSLYLLIAVIITALICVSGCTSERTTPTTTIQYDVVVPVETVSAVNIDGVSYPAPYISNVDSRITRDIQPIKSVQTYTVKSVNIDSTGKSNWIKYTNYEDRFSIYKPWDWEVVELTMSELSGYLSPTDADKIDKSITMNKVVYIYTPSYTGYITIYGVDFSGTLYSIFNDPEKTQISNEFYDGAVGAIQESSDVSSKDGTLQVKVIFVEKDSNYYMINGNPARRMVIHMESNGQSLIGDSYIIAHENAYYMELYFAMVGATQSDATTASTIMQTLTVL